MADIVMVYIVMADIGIYSVTVVMAYIGMAYIVMADIVIYSVA